MAYLTSNILSNSTQAFYSYHYLAAIGAGILFLVEGTLLSLVVFAGKKSSQEISSISVDG